MAEDDTFTTIGVRPSTKERLQDYKVHGMSYDDVINALMDDQPPEAFVSERMAERRTDAST